ncbi:EID1-like F-box protein 3 [Cynara cardunculus var. scolymus]|uniref:F-box domain, cyclin-like protein n=1 Tax=Cynara cardunculus var. scolymus TaxID=59895 RepID=A0A103XP83_CYNCS|nr:EID1-like F-box protein 3 [Cynara cardunculus var. scolymus]KVH94412.1 F-box domain, cyclin-like protein [Cynara cardunculus var. scolymus]
MSANQRVRLNTASSGSGSGSNEPDIFNERVLLLVMEWMKWDVQLLCRTASVCRRLRAMAKRLLWRELCLFRAPRITETLSNGVHSSRMGGGWPALAKLLFFCGGCESSRNFVLSRPKPGHFVMESRFSKTSGRSFLMKRCRGDLLFVSDPCEHRMGDREDDLGVFRGVFRGFRESKTRACLIARQVALEEKDRCPYCGARVWSMTTAGLVPRNAAKRLGSHEGALEYFVCVNGHLHGTCWLAPLSSDEGVNGDDEIEEYEMDGSYGSGGTGNNSGGVTDGFFDDPTAGNRFQYDVYNGCTTR